MNNRGATLIITLTFILAFTLLGFGALQLAGNQNFAAERQEASAQAFWLADGGVQRAFANLPKLFSPMETVNPKPDWFYDIESQRDVKRDAQGNEIYTYKYRWVIKTQGRVNGQKRSIEAIASALDTRFNIKTRGTINRMEKCPPASVTIDCQLVRERQQFSLDAYFEGYNKQQIFDLASRTYTDPNNSGDADPIERITVIKLEYRSSLTLSTDNIVGGQSVFLIIDTTGVTGHASNPPEIRIAGNGAFHGVIWVIGEAQFTGTASIHGAILIEGNPENQTKLAGDVAVELDEQAVEEAVAYLDTNGFFIPQKPKIQLWREI